MEFGQRRRGRRSRLERSYPSALQLYKLPPTEVVSLQEFEELAEKRLRRELAGWTCSRDLSLSLCSSTGGGE